jgi:hypothetical protein
MRASRSLVACAACLLAASSAAAEPFSLGRISVAGGLLPNLSSTTAGNAAGLLGYCVKNKILGGSSAASALGTLTERKAITSSEDYTAGRSGKLLTGQGNSLSLSGLGGTIKGKVCDLVLQRALSFL